MTQPKTQAIMQPNRNVVEALEARQLFSWSAYAQLVNQDQAAVDYASVTGKGVTVAMIDTGIDYTQPSLGGGFGAGKKVIAGYDFLDNDNDPMDESGHGTNTASVVAANPYTVNGVTYQGVAPDAKLVALRVGNESGITDANIERALQWVIANYRTYGISVVNLSLGSGSYTNPQTNAQYSDEFKTLHDDGIFVVAASGNSNDQSNGPIAQDGIAYPAADPNVFAVGAVSATDVITSWSQRGDELDLLAPGENIVMPQLGGGFVTEDGTSFSSPYVAGTAALIKQYNSKMTAGDIGSVLMASGTDNRDGSGETGNTTTLQFSRLDIDAALTLTKLRKGVSSSLKLASSFDTALDTQGVLHAAYYNASTGDLYYASRNTAGLWSKPVVVDSQGDVGAQVSIAVDNTGKVGIGYYDSTNTAVKFAVFNGHSWSTTTVESDKQVGTSPSLAFDIDGNAYLGYYRRTSGDLRLASLARDAGTWTRRTVDGADANVGSIVSVDAGEAIVSSGAFTQYDTTVAVAYNDVTNGDLKYARLDLDDPTATWFMAVVDDLNGVGSISLNLHAGTNVNGLQAQIAYQDVQTIDVKYAYRNTTWFTETVASQGNVGRAVELSFDDSNDPMVTYFDNTKKAIYTSTRSSSTGTWATAFDATSFSNVSVGQNERTGGSILSYLNRDRSDVFSNQLL